MTTTQNNAMGSVASSISSLYAASAAKEVAKYNQSLYNIQAGIIAANHKLEKERFAEARSYYMGKGIATLSKQNIGMGRTSLSLLSKSMENLYIDEAFSDYNASMGISTAQSQGQQAFAQGKAIVTSKRASAANSLSTGLTDYATSYYKSGVE